MAKKEKPDFKKRFLIIIFIIFNIAVIGWTAYSQFSGSDSAAELATVKINGWLLLPALGLFLIAIAAEIYKYIIMTKKFGDQPDWRVGARTVLLGRYYDNITPAAVGGQPFQIHYMHTHGVKHGYAAIIPIFGLISTQVGFLIVAIISFLTMGGLTDPKILGLGFLGLIFYAIFPIAVIIATFFPKTLSSIISWGVKILARVHIIKDEEKAVAKTSESINNYASCVKQIVKDKKTTAIVIALSVVFHLGVTALPYFIIKAFGGDINFFKCFVTILAVTATVYITPTPGNSGFAEGYFFAVFESLASGYVFWAMLFWRFFTYYIYIICGPIVYGLIAYEKKTGKDFFIDLKDKVRKLASNNNA